jgi:type I restriction enzyme S subunit
MELMKGYKQTELGIFPEDWEIISIDKIFTFYSTSNYSKAQMSLDGDVGCIHYGLIHAIPNTYYNVQKGIKYFITQEQAKYETIKNGDIVMVDASEDLEGVNKSVELSGIENEKYIAGLHTFLLRDTNLLLANNFRGAILNSTIIKNQLLRLAVGMKVFGVSKPQLKTILIPVPPFPEQTVIAEALLNIDELISQTEKLIDKKKAIKQGVMQELLRPKEDWVTKKLGQLLEYEQPTKYIVDSDKYSDNNPIPVLTAGKSFILGYTSEDYNVFENFPVIIFDDFTTSSQFVDFRFKVKSSAMKILKQKSTSVNLKFMFEILNNIHFPVADHKRHWIGEFQNIDLIVPTEDEMNKIGNIIGEFQDEIQSIQSKLQKLKLQKQGMMQALITGKIRLL